MELSFTGRPQPAPHSESLVDEAFHAGAQALKATENFVSEHKIASAVGTAVVVGGVIALTHGRELGVAGEAVAKSFANVGKDAALATGKHETGMLAVDGSGTLMRSLIHKGALPLMTLSAVELAGCSQEKKETARVYKDPEDCEKDGVFTKSYCDIEYQKAKELNDQTTPQFKNQKDCEDKTSLSCSVDTNQSANQSHSSFFFYRPYMSGYAISSPSSGGDSDHQVVTRSSPLYRPTTGSGGDFVTSHGDPVASKSGTTTVSESVMESASRTTSTGESATEHTTSTPSEAFSHSTSTSTSVGESAGEGAHGSFGGEAGGAHGGGGVGE